MKKLKKLLAGVLTLAMAMSMMTMTAFATEEKEGDQTKKVVKIDESKDGESSITIHKYNYSGEGPKGTGTQADASSVPDDATPLPDVKFDIYKVVDKTALLNYYSGDASKFDGDVNPEKYFDEDGNLALPKGVALYATKTTDNKGEAVFDELPLGIYLVIEAGAPSSVTKKADPFLVSIPMTNPVTQDEWLYNVHVYPKNATGVFGDKVKLIKYGWTVGEYEDDGATKKELPLDGVTFILQKYQEAKTTDDGETVAAHWMKIEYETKNGIDNYNATDEEGNQLGTPLNLTTHDGGVIEVTNLSAGQYRFIETDLGSNENYIKDKATVYKFTITRADDGKYSVKYEAPAAVKVSDNATLQDEYTDNNPTAGNVNFKVVNERPKFDKKIEGKDENATLGDDNSDYSVGDTVPYEIEVGIPTKIASMKTFFIKDTPKNLAVDLSTVEVWSGSEKLTGYTPEEEAVEGTGAKGFRLTFDMTNPDEPIKALGGQTITVKYKATILAGAEGELTTTNKVNLVYSDSIQPDGTDPDNPKEEEKVNVREDIAVSNTYKFKVTKYKDSVGDSNKFAGVKFDLYKEVPTGTTGALSVEDAEALGLTLNEGMTWKKVNNSGSLVTDSTGTITQGGLSDGRYCLVETETLEGYNLLDKPVDVTLKIEKTVKVTKTYEQNVKYVDDEVEYEGEWVEKATVEVEYKGDDDGKTADGIYEKDVVNRKGFTLPSTGGMGTFLFTFVGVAMMAAAVILFFTSKKKEAK